MREGILTKTLGKRKQRGKKRRAFTYSYRARHQVALVEHKHQVLVGRLCPEVLLDAPTPRSQRVSSVQDVEDDVTRVQNLVQFVPVPVSMMFLTSERQRIRTYHILFEPPLLKMGSTAKVAWSPSPSPRRYFACSSFSWKVSRLFSASPARSARLPAPILTRFRCALGPNTSEKGALSTVIFAACCFKPLTLFSSRNRLIGSLLDLRRT